MTNELDSIVQKLIRNHSEALDKHIADYFGGSVGFARQMVEEHPFRYILIDGSPELKFSKNDTKFIQQIHTFFGTRAEAIAEGFDVESEEECMTRVLGVQEETNK